MHHHCYEYFDQLLTLKKTLWKTDEFIEIENFVKL